MRRKEAQCSYTVPNVCHEEATTDWQLPRVSVSLRPSKSDYKIKHSQKWIFKNFQDWTSD